ncbi:hypothetical protein PTTG_10279 [Puccinia triticina 1-1 BBBD Race 1]|uniref:Uncharacterized protein n=1 Tax=Puccinia triticina (isolate 1-1 / race 1 (BBBD)) TaxID=630390 RepID=A0A0C4FAN6_PUCT1|nr:hypothetical protein PTTG_10279 [Puccinia triticina 1-1 BBBD Race 1]
MTPPPNCADCLSAKDYVHQARAWARKHGINKRLKRPQEPASTSAPGPSSAPRPSPTTGSKRPLEDSLKQSPKCPCPSGSQTLGLAARFSACPRDPTPIVLSPEPAFPQAPATPTKDTKMVPNNPSHTPSGSPPSSPRSIPQARASRTSSIHTLESTNPPSPPANTSPKAPQLLALPSANAQAMSPDSPPSRPQATSMPTHLPPPPEQTADKEAVLLNRQVAEISRSLHNTFPKNPLWEEAVFTATAVLESVGAFRNMYCNLLHLATVTPAQHRCRYATFLAKINQLAKRLELPVIVPANKRAEVPDPHRPPPTQLLSQHLHC